jgi:hypothetical protein
LPLSTTALEIEMQSGDVIIIEAASFAVETR